MTWWLAQNVVVTAALALVVAVACRLLRIGPVARHALWVLVLIKFITPPLVVWPWTIPGTGLFSTDFNILGTGLKTANEPAPALLTASEPVVVASTPRVSEPVDHPSIHARMPAQPFNWLPGILVAGIAGSVFFLSLEGARILRLRRRVSRGRDPGPALERRVRDLAGTIGASPIPIRVIDGISSPMIWAAGRPQLLWPADLPPDSSDACTDGLIVHELAHIRRRDHIVGWIELAAGVLWWWNPLFWFVRASRREQAELACDAWVISVLPNGRRAYRPWPLSASGLQAAAYLKGDS
jgi:bla regulator protein BlaR1